MGLSVKITFDFIFNQNCKAEGRITPGICGIMTWAEFATRQGRTHESARLLTNSLDPSYPKTRSLREKPPTERVNNI